MLKIKDDIDLKELEKFGFHQGLENNWIYVNKVDRYLVVHISVNENSIIENYTEKGQDILFDLIQAGYIEKVEEQNNEETYNIPI